jgi:hypothetical protein
VFFCPKVVGRPGHKGGVYRNFQSIIQEIRRFFLQEPKAVVTTFFDFYAMPDDWPGLTAAKRQKSQGRSVGEVAQTVERAWQEEITKATKDLPLPTRFVPYVQMHELETLLFASPKNMAEEFLRPQLESRFAEIVAKCGSCEEIDDGASSAPSKRIENLFSGYRKGRNLNKPDRRPHAPGIVGRIGIATLRKVCPHFDTWVTKLEAFAPTQDYTGLWIRGSDLKIQIQGIASQD